MVKRTVECQEDLKGLETYRMDKLLVYFSLRSRERRKGTRQVSGHDFGARCPPEHLRPSDNRPDNRQRLFSYVVRVRSVHSCRRRSLAGT
jgi:hypothetical protein